MAGIINYYEEIEEISSSNSRDQNHQILKELARRYEKATTRNQDAYQMLCIVKDARGVFETEAKYNAYRQKLELHEAEQGIKAILRLSNNAFPKEKVEELAKQLQKYGMSQAIAVQKITSLVTTNGGRILDSTSHSGEFRKTQPERTKPHSTTSSTPFTGSTTRTYEKSASKGFFSRLAARPPQLADKRTGTAVLITLILCAFISYDLLYNASVFRIHTLLPITVGVLALFSVSKTRRGNWFLGALLLLPIFCIAYFISPLAFYVGLPIVLVWLVSHLVFRVFPLKKILVLILPFAICILTYKIGFAAIGPDLPPEHQQVTGAISQAVDIRTAGMGGWWNSIKQFFEDEFRQPGKTSTISKRRPVSRGSEGKQNESVGSGEKRPEAPSAGYTLPSEWNLVRLVSFDQTALSGDLWRVVWGSWSIEDRCLAGRNSDSRQGMSILFDRLLSGDVALDFYVMLATQDARLYCGTTSSPGQMDGSIARTGTGKYHATELTLNNKPVTQNAQHGLAPNKWHHILMAVQSRSVSITIDGTMVIDHETEAHPTLNIYPVFGAIKGTSIIYFDNIRVYHRKPSALPFAYKETSYEQRIGAGRMLNNTGILVQKGDSLRFVASAISKYKWDPSKPSVGAGGTDYAASEIHGGKRFLVPEGACGGLVGKIGTAGKWFFIGRKKTIIAVEAGELILSINDMPNGFETNSGALKVTIRHKYKVSEHL